MKSALAAAASIILALYTLSANATGRSQYIRAPKELNDRVRQAIQKCTEHGDCDTLLDDKLICLPFLWAEIRGHPAVTNLTAKSELQVMFSAKRGSTFRMMQNQLLQTREEVNAF